MNKYPLLVIGLLLLGMLVLFIPVYLVEAAPLAQTAQEGQAIFQTKCASCHTIGGGKLVGPDLQGVATRRQLDWIKAFITAPDKVIASGDPVAVQLIAENNNVRMPNLGLKDAEIAALLAYLQDPAAAGTAPAAAQPAALPPGRAQNGQLIFMGNTKLANGGTPCIACHTVAGTGALGGGSLGPDLTQVYRRYGEPGLASALGTIAFPTMQGPFLNHPLNPQEQADLVAFFKWTDGAIPAPAPNRMGFFLLVGGLGAATLFGAMVFFWPRQRESLAERLRKSQ